MIVLYTDFGVADPYVGQMHAVLAREAPGVPVVDLLHAVPGFDIRAGAYLLPALAVEFPPDSIFIGVVDPGVGSGRRPVLVRADERWYIGPDNGLFHMIERRATQRVETRIIQWRPQRLSISFHGRDLFAPVAARLAAGKPPNSVPGELTTPPGNWPDDLPAVIYIDHYGNATTGLRASQVDRKATLVVAGRQLSYAPVFSSVGSGEAFWYENANGLVEVAVNQGSAMEVLGLYLGDEIVIIAESPQGTR